jgi:nucleotidyltransferase substrate binding protein (TIGR01987 family)
MLVLSSLSQSIDSLHKAVMVYSELLQDHDATSDLMLTLRAGVIQNFEFTYDQSWKLMKRWLNEHVDAHLADGLTRRGLFRLAAESKLIEDVEKWMEFHQARNLSSHTYSEGMAIDVFMYAGQFEGFAKDLLERLAERNE